jgi:hypothetical protein
LHVRPAQLCGDLSAAVAWARAHPADAAAMAGAARRFATGLLGPRMTHEYLLTVLNEVHTIPHARVGGGGGMRCRKFRWKPREAIKGEAEILQHEVAQSVFGHTQSRLRQRIGV